MKSCITKHGLGSFRAPVIQVKVVFPGEAHASVNLDSAIAHRAARVARVKLGDGNSSGGIRSVVLESPGRVVNRGTGALRFEVHVGALVLHGLKNANGFAELFARFRVFHGDIERAVHSAYHFGGKGGRGDSTGPRQDRKSTRLNSSHGYISYAVFCLKKKNITARAPLARRCSLLPVVRVAVVTWTVINRCIHLATSPLGA